MMAQDLLRPPCSHGKILLANMAPGQMVVVQGSAGTDMNNRAHPILAKNSSRMGTSR